VLYFELSVCCNANIYHHMIIVIFFFFFFSSRRRHTRWPRDWSSDVCSSDLFVASMQGGPAGGGDAHHSGGGPENVEVQFTTNRGFTRLRHSTWNCPVAPIHRGVRRVLARKRNPGACKGRCTSPRRIGEDFLDVFVVPLIVRLSLPGHISSPSKR